MEIIEVKDENIKILHNLAQAYEAEFSNLTNKLPDKNGIFKLDAEPSDENKAMLVYKNDVPIGFSIFNINPKSFSEIYEFYIIPSCRRSNYGKELAFEIFKTFPGKWVVKQIQGAEKAISFWRSTISEYTKSKYEEDVYDDSYWGKVTRQRFNS
jgi:predicted acetyltransferase